MRLFLGGALHFPQLCELVNYLNQLRVRPQSGDILGRIQLPPYKSVICDHLGCSHGF